MKAPRLRPRPAGPPEEGTDFVPITEVARNEAPRATIDPDKSLTWLRRVMPIMGAHKGSSSPRWWPRSWASSCRSWCPIC